MERDLEPLEAKVLLHADDVADSRVLYLALVSSRDPAGSAIVPGLENIRSTKKAADVVGSERRQIVHAETTRLKT